MPPFCCPLFENTRLHHNGYCERRNIEALDSLRARLCDSSASVVFIRTDGRTLRFDGVRVDSIGPSAENPGVIGVEFENDGDRLVHVPFVQSWEIEYA